jgi:peptidoglycan/LPS O-acetylase OafA/YrhL
VSQRFKELDSLRGLAACAVVAHHFLLISPQTNLLVYGGYRGKYELINALVYSPIHILWAGPQAVMLFFLLSGFVLSLPFFSDKKISYFSFLIKRICRIYIPYAAAVTAAIVVAIYCSRHGIHELSGWFNLVWTTPISWQLVLDHYLFLGSFDNKQFDPVIWSLVQEMRISIIFPLLMIFVLKFDWKFILVSAIVLYYIVGYQIDPLIAEKLHMQSNDLLHTPCFIGIFLAGALIFPG